MTYPYNGQHGFIPDVIKLLEKYQMLHIVHSFVDTSRFPSKMPGIAYSKANCTKVRFVHGIVEHWHKSFIALELFTLNFSLIGRGTALNVSGNCYHLVRLLYK